MTSAEYDEFYSLVYADHRTEVQCARFLHHAQTLLVPRTYASARSYLENVSLYGRSDFYVVARVKTDRREEENYIYFFEAKAPQLYVMEFDKSLLRCVPSGDLIQAENQLIHYVSEASGNREFLAQHDISDPRNVKAGGIVIGRRSDRYLKNDDAQNSSARLATRALKIREDFFYGTSGMRVFLWDRILDFVNPSQI